MRKSRTTINLVDYPEIIDLYKNGLSLKNVAKKFNCNAETIRLLLKKQNIQLRLKCFHRKNNFNLSFFEKINSHDKAQILGLLAADGNVSKKDGTTSISLIETDIEYLEIVKNKVEFSGNLYLKKQKGQNNQRTLCLNSIKMKADLLKLGIFPAKSLVLKFPTFDQVPEEFIHSFVLGYFEGDGSIWITTSHNNRYTNYHIGICGTLDFCNELRDLAKEKLNISCQVNKHGNIYIFEIGGNFHIIKFLDWIYKDSTFQMKRKYNKYLDLKKKYENLFEYNNGSYRKTRTRFMKLNPNQVLEIRKRLKLGNKMKDIAKEYNICYDYVYAIKIRRTWKFLTEDNLKFYDNV